MKTTRLILVGGFLGAGKTTLVWEAAQNLSRAGRRVGLITNDQAPELVDTALLSRSGVRVAELSGSCFCCNYQGMLDAISTVGTQAEADVLIAEPVGSCTDLSATILQPLKDHMKGELMVSPFSVMADPARLADILDGGSAGLHPSAAYIFRKQLEEADILVISKIDTQSPAQLSALRDRLRNIYPEKSLVMLSAQTGEGVQEWIDMVVSRDDSGHHLADVDYDVYAEGEAVLGWLNATAILHGENIDWNHYAADLLNELGKRFDHLNAAVGHIKLILESGESYVIGNLTGRSDTHRIRGSVKRTPEVRLTLNARVEMPPEELESIVREILASTGDGSFTVTPGAWRCLSPGRPNPTHRYDRVVAA